MNNPQLPVHYILIVVSKKEYHTFEQSGVRLKNISVQYLVCPVFTICVFQSTTSPLHGGDQVVYGACGMLFHSSCRASPSWRTTKNQNTVTDMWIQNSDARVIFFF